MKDSPKKANRDKSEAESKQRKLLLDETSANPAVISFSRGSAKVSREKRISEYRNILKSDRFYEDQIEM